MTWLRERLDTGTSPAIRAVFFRSLSTLLTCGVPITRSLEVLGRQGDSPRLAAALRRASREVQQGNPLSRTLANTGLFTPLHVQLVAVGETSGSLHLVLDRLARDTEKSSRLWMKVKNAMTYPLVVLGVSLVLVFALQTLLFRDLLKFVQGLGVELPFTTRLMQGCSAILSSPWCIPLGLLAAGALVWAWRWFRSHLEAQRRLWDLALRLPGLNAALRSAMAVDFCRTLALGMSTGVPLLRCLELAAGTGALAVRERVAQASRQIQDGRPLNLALRDTELFPLVVWHMIAVGEDTGKTPELLDRAAQLCEDGMDSTLDAATAVMQPMAMGVVGLLVGFIVLSVMGPLMKVVESF